MKLLLKDKDELASYLSYQLNTIFPDPNKVSKNDLLHYINDVLDRTEYCFKNINKPYFNENNNLIFNHLNSDQYAMFLYLFSNTVYKSDKREDLASKIFLLNKMLHGIDAFYKIELPEIFIFVHPLGTVLGRASYGNYFAVYQNCTVGSTSAGIYPVFQNATLLYSRTSVIGKCTIGGNVVFGANTSIIDKNINKDSLVLGSYPNNKIITNRKNVIDRIFK